MVKTITRKFEVYYITASRYDDEGYVHRYWRGVVPSNTLMCLKTLTEDLAAAGSLGEDVQTRVRVYDDCVQRVPIEKIIRRHRKGKARVLVGFTGVQSNQFPRASDLALQLREAGVPVMIGGFHVSGMLAMFPEPTPDLQRLLDAGVTLVKGEVEGNNALAEILRDALADSLKPIYDIKQPPDLSNVSAPRPDRSYLKRFLLGDMATLDTSRGCPFRCSFCTIINVQGRRMRARSAQKVLQTVEENYDEVKAYFFTDDNMSRSPIWEELFDGLIALRKKGKPITFMMQIDTRAYLIPNFLDKAAAAGCDSVFIGMETVNPRNIEATGKTQNDADDYAEMVKAWHDRNIRVRVGYIIGLPHDTPESVRQDVLTLRDVVKVDEASFFMLTPLPGSEDHKTMIENHVCIDADLNNLDSTHETFRHPNFKPGEWQETYFAAWREFYSKESIVKLLLRVPRGRYWHLFWSCIWYRWSSVFVRTHPMSTGLFRFKERKARRKPFPRESVWKYARRRIGDFLWGSKVYARLFIEFQEIWMLTRRREDPRWKTLSELYELWSRACAMVSERYSGSQLESASKEIQKTLAAAAERMSALSAQPGILSRRARKHLERKAREVEAYIASLNWQQPTHDMVETARRYAHSLIDSYENIAITYVKQRRKLNAYRRELLEQLRKRRFFSVNLFRLQWVVIMEFLLELRFWITALTQRA